MAYLTSDIIDSLGLRQKLKYNSALQSIYYICDKYLDKNKDYHKNESGEVIIEQSGADKIKKYYEKRGIIKKGDSVRVILRDVSTKQRAQLRERKSIERESRGYHAIYALLCPQSYQAKYIGKTMNIISRYNHHMNVCYHSIKEQKEKSEWVQSLLDKGLKPFFTILEICKHEDTDERERYWIDYFLDKGFRLFNVKYGDKVASNLSNKQNKVV